VEIKRIAAGVGENRKKINSIIDITRLTDEHLKNLDISVDKISNIVTAMLQHNPAQLNSEINRILENGHEAATRITNMVQQAQNKRLSVDLLTPDTLKQVFRHLQEQAESQNLELMINQPSDLFQIDTSYLHGNKTVTLILHVPMVSEENKLNLLQFIPFPLSQSLGANTTVLCEGRSVLRTDIEDSCLGALYLHNLPGTLKHCHFQLGETREHVFQTGPSQWLVSAPETFSSVLQCEKSHETIFVKPISSITVNPGCKLYLKSHVIQPDTNQRSKFEIRHHSWEWDVQQLFPTSDLSEIANELIELRKQGNHIVTAKDLQNIKKFEQPEIDEWFKPNYVAIISITMAILFTLYITFRIYKFCTRKPLQPIDEALNHLERKEQLHALELKNQIREYEQELNSAHHQNIIRIGDRAPRNLNMADYTVTTPTNPMAPPVYPDINEKPTQY